jgi:hypothetical protein
MAETARPRDQASALGTAIADPLVTALACSATGGHDISTRSST